MRAIGAFLKNHITQKSEILQVFGVTTSSQAYWLQRVAAIDLDSSNY
jgi:hypothetical protein